MRGCPKRTLGPRLLCTTGRHMLMATCTVAMPSIRYGSGALAEMTFENCQCTAGMA